MGVTVKFDLVRRYLRVSESTLRKFGTDKYLVRTDSGRYAVEDIDAFLQGCARNFGDINLAWDALRSGRIVLLKHDEVIGLFGIAKRRLPRLRQMYLLPHLKFPGCEIRAHVRYCQRSIQQVLGVEPMIKAWDAAKICGLVNVAVIYRAVAAGVLTKADNPLDKLHLYLTQASFRRFLRERLPDWVDVDDWIEDRMSHDRPLIPAAELAQVLNVSRDEVPPRLRELKAWYIPAGSVILVSPLWVDSVIDYAVSLSNSDIAKLYGVSGKSVWLWRNSGALICPIELHRHGEEKADEKVLYESCLVAVLCEDANGTSRKVREFVRAQLHKKPCKMLSVAEAAVRLGCDEARAMEAIEQGHLFAIRTPLGTLRVPGHHQMRLVKKRLEE